MKLLKKLALLNVCMAIVFNGFAQQTDNTAENFMNGSGKIYVVVAVVVVILLGLFIYLFSLDKKISKLEKMKKE